jgi:hypothetical protein
MSSVGKWGARRFPDSVPVDDSVRSVDSFSAPTLGRVTFSTIHTPYYYFYQN